MMLDIDNIDSSEGEEDWMYSSAADNKTKQDTNTGEGSSSSDYFSKYSSYFYHFLLLFE